MDASQRPLRVHALEKRATCVPWLALAILAGCSGALMVEDSDAAVAPDGAPAVDGAPALDATSAADWGSEPLTTPTSTGCRSRS